MSRRNHGSLPVVPLPDVDLTGERLVLRRLLVEDAAIFLKLQKENESFWAKVEPRHPFGFYTRTFQEAILKAKTVAFNQGRGMQFGLFLNDELIGKVSLSEVIRGPFQSAMLGYGLDSRYTGQGLMTEAISLVEGYAYNIAKLHRLEASTMLSNEKSQAVLMRCGFKRLGLNEHYLEINGTFEDHYTFYKTREMAV